MAKPETIKIRNWPKFQHYKRRNPPWIRLYRDVIDSDEWRGLSDAAGRLLPELWLLASESHPGGTFSADLEGIAWQTGRPMSECENLVSPLLELHNSEFITLPASIVASAGASEVAGMDASTDASMVASAFASKAVSQSRGQRTEGESETTHDQPKAGRDHALLYVDLDEFLVFAKDFDVHPKHIDIVLDRT